MTSLLHMSTKVHYGLMFLSRLSSCYQKGVFISLQEFSLETGFVSGGYLEEIVCLLRKNKIVKAKRGAKGGYQLTKHPKEISMKKIIEVLENSSKQLPCQSSQCSMGSTCTLKKFWDELQEILDQKLEETTLQDP